MRRTGRTGAAFLLVAALLALAFLAVRPADAAPGHMIGFDMRPSSGSSAASAGADSCVEVEVGDTFEADVFATNLNDLTHFELRVDFDASILRFEKDLLDLNHFLAKDGGGPQFPQVDQEKPGRWFIAAADTTAPDSGSGTLVRMSFTALEKGVSTLAITRSPTAAAPLMESIPGSFLGDSNGDTRWDAALGTGKAAVESSCSDATPVVTPEPTNLPATTPRPGGSTPEPGDDGSSSDGGSGDGNDGGPDGGSSGDGPGDSDDPDATGEPQVGNIGSDDEDDTGSDGNPRDNPGGDEDDGVPGSSSDDSGSSDTVLILLAGAAVALGVLGMALLLMWRRNAG